MDFDILVKGGTVVDGSESGRAFRADVGVEGDTICAVGDLPAERAARVIDATGKVVAPGFIDMHTHSDFTSLETPTADSKVRSGVTTEVLGQCGGSAFPLYGEALSRRAAAYELGNLKITWKDIEGYVREGEGRGCSVNRVLMVGHNMIRGSVMGYHTRPPSPDELKRMVREVEIAMEGGVFGLTTGLIYPPGCYTGTDEIVELCRPVATGGGLYASHVRGEGDNLEKAVEEVLEIHERTGIPVHISHLKCSKRRNWGKIGWLRERLFAAREDGADLTADRYPYTAAATDLSAVLPEWSYEGTHDEMIGRLKDIDAREKIRREVSGTYSSEQDWEAVQVSCCEKEENRCWEGMRMTEVASQMHLDPFDALCELLISDGGRTAAVYFQMKEENLEAILRWPFVMIGSDASARNAGKAKTSGKPHPRCYGTSARVLGRYVREKAVLSLEEAIWKLAGFPARRLGLADRGRIGQNMKADVVVFDAETVADTATFGDPHRYSTGFEQVIVNGVLTVEKGEHLGALAGEILRK